MKRNLKASGIVVSRRGMTRRVVKVQDMFFSCTLEVVLEASAG